MATKVKARVSRAIITKARELLAFARTCARQSANWSDFNNALFGIGGKANELFTNERERTAFTKTAESKQIYALMDDLPTPPIKDVGDLLAHANGAISVRLPRSVHAALLAEAQAEGVSLNQLCLSKLVAQLRAVV